MSSEHPKNKLVELKGQIAGAIEAMTADFGAKLKELSEYLHGLEKHEVHAIVSAPHHHPYYESLGLQFVPVGDIIDKPAKRGRKPNAAKKTALKPAKAGKRARKPMSPEAKAKIAAAQTKRWAAFHAKKRK